MADTVEELVKRLLDYADNDDHERLCQGREYSCTCGYDDKRDPLLREAASALEALVVERDEAQSMVQAWDHVFGTIEAHIMDRVNMSDPANPELYLEIIRSDIANIKRNSDQICAARWADYKRHEARALAAEAKRDKAIEALEKIEATFANATRGNGNPERDLGWTGARDNWGQIFAWFARSTLNEIAP